MRPIIFSFIMGCFLITVALAGFNLKPIKIIPIENPQEIVVAESRGFCTLTKAGASAGWSPNWALGHSVITYFDPVGCPDAPTYPFGIESFAFTLFDPGSYQWPVQVDVVIYDLAGDSCDGPGAELCRYTVVCDEMTYRNPSVGTFQFPSPCCVTGPFYVGIEYTDSGNGPFPSITYDGGTDDTCNVWLNVGSGWIEWSDFSFPPTLHPLYWVYGETQDPNCGRVAVWDSISTGCLNLTVGTNGNFGNQGTPGYTMDYSLSGDCDPNAEFYLYDGSPLLIYHDGSQMVAYYAMYFHDPFLLVNDAHLPVPTVTTAEYDIYETGTFVTPDQMIGMDKKWWAPKSVDSCEFIIQRLRVYSYDGASHQGVSICEAVDWDIPSDDPPYPYNSGGFDAATRMIYTRGTEIDGAGCQPNNTRYGGMAMIAYYLTDPAMIDSAFIPYSAYLLDNETYVLPYLGWDPVVTQGIIQTPGYGVLADSADLNTVMTYFYNHTINPGDTLVFFTVLTTVQNGGPPSQQKSVNDLIANVEKGKVWASDHVIPLVPPEFVCGDANSDDLANVGDAVFLINFVFKNGPAPDPIEAGDANCDDLTNVGDAVYLINFVFKTGPAPCAACP